MNLILPCAPGCCEQGCELADDDFNRASLTSGSPITWTGDTGDFVIMSSVALQCNTEGAVIIASDVPAHSGGQYLEWKLAAASGGSDTFPNDTGLDFIVNYVDSDNFDFVRFAKESGASYLEAWSRVSGTETLIDTYGFVLSVTNPSYIRIYRFGTTIAAYVEYQVNQAMRLKAECPGSVEAGCKFGLRSPFLASNKPRLDYVDYQSYGDPCPEYDGRCTLCDEYDEPDLELEIEITATGDICQFLTGTYIVPIDVDAGDFGRGRWRECRFRLLDPGNFLAIANVQSQDFTSPLITFVIGAATGAGWFGNLSFEITDHVLECSDEDAITMTLVANTGDCTGGSGTLRLLPP